MTESHADICPKCGSEKKFILVTYFIDLETSYEDLAPHLQEDLLNALDFVPVSDDKIAGVPVRRWAMTVRIADKDVLNFDGGKDF